MKSLLVFLVSVAFLVLGLIIFVNVKANKKLSGLPSSSPFSINNFENQPKETNLPATQIIAEGLDTPWALAFLPDGGMLVTERKGDVRFIDKGGKTDNSVVATIGKVRETGEGGLLGMTLDPDFAKNNYVYFYYTYGGSGNDSLNRVVRMTYSEKKLFDEQIIVDKIPGAANHNGGRIKFGPDKFLYISTGDAENPSQAQDKNSFGGKILRVNTLGEPADGNPFGNPVYSYGHRNVQGLAWDWAGGLWATEHGRSGVLSGLDEVNFIERGKNYGWPTIQGNEKKDGMETAKRNSGSATWAPSGAVFFGNSLFFGGLRGQALYEAVIQNNSVVEVKEHLKGQFGRLRDVVLGPDGMLYVTTSNRDGRGNPVGSDDRIIRINPTKL